MKRKKMVVALLVLAACVGVAVFGVFGLHRDPVPEGMPTTPPEGAGWIDLLDAEHASAWKNTTDDEDIFEIDEGMLHIFGTSFVHLRYADYTAGSFGDFDLHLEFKVAKGTNSGVFVRSQPNDPVYRGFEIQVLDDFGKAPHKNRSGAIYDVTTPMYNLSRPAGEWNSYDIQVHGHEVKVVMNGWLVVHTDLSKMTMLIGKYKAPFAELPLEGHLMLQDHGGEVWYRNILIREGTPASS